MIGLKRCRHEDTLLRIQIPDFIFCRELTLKKNIFFVLANAAKQLKESFKICLEMF